MPRPKQPRSIKFDPTVTFFKPQGVPMRQLQQVELTLDELEAIRLTDLEDLTMEQAAEQMHISRSTLQRLAASAHRKLTSAITTGQAILIHQHIDANFPSPSSGQGRRRPT